MRFLLFVIMIYAGSAFWMAQLQELSLLSLAIMASTAIFAVCTLMATYRSIYQKSELLTPLKTAYWGLSSLIYLLVGVYLFAFDVIGIRTWA